MELGEFDEFDLDTLKEDEPEEDDLDEEWEDEEEDKDEDAEDLLKEDQKLDYGREDMARKLKRHTGRTPKLTGGDVDAAWEYSDVGEETVGGENPTPDQSDVDDEGEAMGLSYGDNEPLHTDDKLEERDEEPWELNPKSDPEFGARTEEEFQQPLHRMTGNVQRKRATESSAARRSAKAAKNEESKPAAQRVRAAAAGGHGTRARGRALSGGGRSAQTVRRAAGGSRSVSRRRAKAGRKRG